MHESSNTLFQHSNVEVNQQTNLHAGDFQISQQLRLAAPIISPVNFS
jgi:hypothetical protein